MAKLIDLILGRSKLKEDNARLEWLSEHNNGSYMRIIAEKDAEIERLRELLNKAYQYGISSEAYQKDEDMREIYEFLYGGDDE